MNQPTKVVGRRTAAVVIDYILTTAVNFAIFFAMADTEEDVLRKLGAGEVDPDTSTYGNFEIGDHEYAIVGGDFLLYLLIITVIGVLYWMILPGLKGWTLGKLVAGVRVVKEDGTCPAGIGPNVVRQLLWIVDDFPYFVPLVAPIVALTSDRNQRVGDKVAKTLVIRADAVGQPLAGPGVPAGAQPLAGQGVPAGAQPGAPGSGAAGWYPDPYGQASQRYWDGSRWTEHTG